MIGNQSNANQQNGIYIESSFGSILTNNVCNGNDSGLLFYDSTECTITGNYLNGNHDAFWTDGSIGCSNSFISGNHLNNNTGYGFNLVAGCVNNVIMGNFAYSGNGTNFSGSTTNNQVAHNYGF